MSIPIFSKILIERHDKRKVEIIKRILSLIEKEDEQLQQNIAISLALYFNVDMINKNMKRKEKDKIFKTLYKSIEMLSENILITTEQIREVNKFLELKDKDKMERKEGGCIK